MPRVFKSVTSAIVMMFLLKTPRNLPAADSPPPPAPLAAVFPLGGDAPADTRDQVGFALRAKLKRDGTYAPIDGPTMADAASASAASAVPIDASTDAATIRKLATPLSPTVILWGEVDATDAGPKLILNLLDLRRSTSASQRFQRTLAHPTDLRLAIEDALKLLAGIKPFERVSEIAANDDPAIAARFARNPNLLPAGNFAKPEAWRVILQNQSDPPVVSTDLPGDDTAAILPAPADANLGPAAHVLAMRLSRQIAETNGLACLSDPIPVAADTRYRLTFRFYSQGPTQHVFVKGYDGNSGDAEREIYRRQIPPSGPTNGKWQTIVCDLTPHSDEALVKTVRVDLYAYAAAGVVMFGDVQLKLIDNAAPPATAPAH
jgi:hypothetical protein